MNLFDDPDTGDLDLTDTSGHAARGAHASATFDEFVGQEDVLAPGKPLREAIERDRLQSIILWGPPGTGKTTLARFIAKATQARFVSFSAVLAGIKEIKEVMAAAGGPGAESAAGRSCSSTRFTASTRLSRMRFCRASRPAISS